MTRPALRTTALSLVLAGTLAACGTVDSALLSGTGGFTDFAASNTTKAGDEGESTLAKIDDPKVFLRSAAEIAENEQNYESAAGHWARLYQVEPANPTYALKLSENLRYIGRYEDAERILRQSLRVNTGHVDLSEELAKNLVASGRLREGAANLTALAERPGLPAKRVSRLRSAIGVAFDRAGKHAEAQRSYQMALQADPLNAIALSNLGLSHALSGDLDLAEKRLREALVAPNASVQVRQNLAMVLALKGEQAGAERLARQDLPPALARGVVGYYGGIGDQASAWEDAASQ